MAYTCEQDEKITGTYVIHNVCEGIRTVKEEVEYNRVQGDQHSGIVTQLASHIFAMSNLH